LDIGDPDCHYTADEQVRRLTLFKDAYGISTCSINQIAAFMLARQVTLATWAKGRGHIEMAAWATSAADWTVSNIIDRVLPTAFPE
jgi:hypothetical protein